MHTSQLATVFSRRPNHPLCENVTIGIERLLAFAAEAPLEVAAGALCTLHNLLQTLINKVSIAATSQLVCMQLHLRCCRSHYMQVCVSASKLDFSRLQPTV